MKNPHLANTSYRLFRNGDNADSNYYSQYMGAVGAVIVAARSNISSVLYTYANTGNATEILISRDSDGYMRANTIHSEARASATDINATVVTSKNTTTNITSLRVTAPLAGYIGTGSKLTLCVPRTS
jgi:galactokinase/mevalonate kinase-like predicted kinase